MATRSEALAIRRPGDRPHFIRMAVIGEQGDLVDHVPHPHLPIRAHHGQALPIMRPCQEHSNLYEYRQFSTLPGAAHQATMPGRTLARQSCSERVPAYEQCWAEQRPTED